jgi:hypothetical protein
MGYFNPFVFTVWWRFLIENPAHARILFAKTSVVRPGAQKVYICKKGHNCEPHFSVWPTHIIMLPGLGCGFAPEIPQLVAAIIEKFIINICITETFELPPMLICLHNLAVTLTASPQTKNSR